MKPLILALKKHPIVYVARDLERALGLGFPQNYFIVTNYTPFARSLKAHKSIILIKEKKLLDTHELFTHSKTIAFVKKLTAPQFVVFKTTPQIERICQKNNWKLLNPSATLANTIEEKISQLKWLGNLTKLLPPHQVTLCKNILWKGKKFILQFNRAHTGSGTLLIESEEQIKDLQQKFPNRPVRITKYIEGLMFTNNNVVWGKKILCGNINYQITGLKPFTNRPFATIGNDWQLPHQLLNKNQLKHYELIAKKVGQRLLKDGWRGLFGIDVILDKKTQKLYLIEINARQPASTTYESQLQKHVSRIMYHVSSFEAHLASLLKLDPDHYELIKITNGAQIIQKVTKDSLQIKQRFKKIGQQLKRNHFNTITYNNTDPETDLLRIQSTRGIIEEHNQFNEYGKKIIHCLEIEN